MLWVVECIPLFRFNSSERESTMKNSDKKSSAGEVEALRRQIVRLEATTDRLQHVEAALRASEEKCRTLFESTSDAIMLFGEKTFIDCNPATLVIFGCDSTEEFCRMHPADLSPPTQPDGRTSRAAAEERIETALREGTCHFEWVHCRVDGSEFPADVLLNVMTLAGRKVLQALVRDITELKQAEQAARTAHLKLVTAREDERRRLASELHDSMGQRMIAIHYKLRSAVEACRNNKKAELSEQLDQMSKACGELIGEVRAISHGLFPPTLETLGLVPTLKQLVNDLEPKQNVSVTCEAGLDAARFDGDIEIMLFRIAQEALHNAMRHSNADNIDIRLEHRGNWLVLQVVDDGKGFDPNEVGRKGLGLTTMTERARAGGARMEISSRKGQTGVQVSVRLQDER